VNCQFTGAGKDGRFLVYHQYQGSFEGDYGQGFVSGI
jgi:hypothetical protein